MSSSTQLIPPDVGPPGILIVEDEQVTALELQNRLRRFGYRVTGVISSGEDALTSIDERRPDLVLMDIFLDGKITGTQAADVINQRVGIPVVYLTAYSDPVTLDQIKKTEYWGFLRKPFQPETLHAVIQLALAQHQKEQVRRQSERDGFQKFALECKEQLDRFAYTAGHDLKEPLRTARAFVELLARRAGTKLDQEELRLLALAKDGMVRLNTLLEDLIAYAQAGSSSTGSHPNTSSHNALRGALENLHDVITETGAVIAYDDLPAVSANPVQLMQVFQNLLSNAIKYQNPENTPHVWISAEPRMGEIVFRVKDNGTGFEPKHAESIFAPFKRLHAQGEYPGTGIGLAICRRIVEAHGGRIWAEAKPGQGAIFFFTLPN